MNQTRQNRLLQIIWYTLPISIILLMVWLSKSSAFEANATRLAPAIIIDLLVTLPLVYFLIIRKKSIPKTTVVLVLVIGVITAGIILPKEHQWLLDYAKIWVLPLVELFVITYVIITVRKSVKAFKSKNTGQFDFHTNLKLALADIMPSKVIPFVAMEISAFYYGFIRWKKLKLQANEFSYHQESGTRSVLIVLLFLIAIETFVFHLLLINNYPIAAWILTGLSIYSGFQILGILKSLSQRPISIIEEEVKLKYGILAEAKFQKNNILSISKLISEIDEDSPITSFSPLGQIEGHNILLELKNPITISGLYGISKQASSIALFIDEPQVFISQLEINTKQVL